MLCYRYFSSQCFIENMPGPAQVGAPLKFQQDGNV